MATSIGKLNVTNIKSPLGGGKTPIHKLNFTSGLKVGSNKFAGTPAQLGDTAKFNISRIDDIISLEDRAKLSEQKISSLTRILALQKKNKNKERDQLTEINDSLKDIGNALALDFANRITEEKQELNLGKDQIRKDKLSFKEKLLETGKRMGETIKKTTASITAPALGIFGRIFEFLKTVFTGALIGKSLDWLEQDGSVEKLKTFFDRIKENLPTFGRILGAVGIVAMLTKVVGLMTTMTLAAKGLKAGLLMFANPLTWKILAAVALGVLVWKAGKWLHNQWTGGEQIISAQKAIEQQGISQGLAIPHDALARADRTEAIMLSDDGSQLFFNDKGSMRPVEITNPRAQAWIIKEYGQAKLDELLAAREKIVKKKQDLEKLKKQLKKEINSTRDAFNKETQKLKDARRLELRQGINVPSTVNTRSQKSIETYLADTIGNPRNEKFSKIEEKIRLKYQSQINEIIARKKGGAFSSGKTYLVGENGPELARFNGHGTIERNGRTAQLLANKFGSGVNIVPFDLPTVKAAAPKLSSNTKATVANDIVTYSSVNITNPYMVEVPEIFGITV